MAVMLTSMTPRGSNALLRKAAHQARHGLLL
jgi:hypothetical protein